MNINIDVSAGAAPADNSQYLPGWGPVTPDMREHDATARLAPDFRREAGTVFLTVSERNRVGLATSIERLIDLLDSLEADPDLEPDVGDYEPSIGGNGLNHLALDCELDESDDEPSLGSRNPIAPSVTPLGFWQVRPYYVSEADWAAHLRRHDDVWSPPTDCQTRWGEGTLANDREDEHDGAEPENEHGGAWAESGSLSGRLSGAGHDDDREPSLSLPESLNQATRWQETSDWHVEDGEADYVEEGACGRLTARESDDEDNLGSSAMRLPSGAIVNDREASGMGMDNLGDDHGCGTHNDVLAS